VPPGADEELLDCLITATLVIGDLSQGTALDGPLPERPSFVLTQLPEDGGHNVALDRRCLGIDTAT
jgi:hypothetical protein